MKRNMKKGVLYVIVLLVGSLPAQLTFGQQPAPSFVIPNNFGCIVRGMSADFSNNESGIEIVEGSGSVRAIVCGTKIDNLKEIPLQAKTITTGFLQSAEMGRLQLIVTSFAPPNVEVAFERDKISAVMKFLGIGSEEFK